MRILRLLCAVLAPAILAGAVPTIEQNLSLHSAAGPQISPDGKTVAYEVSKTNWEDNAFETEIWVAHVAAPHDPYQLTSGKKSSSSPRWSPDGKTLAFISDRDGKKQIYVISPMGGEARAVSKVETGVTAFKWTPDGKAMVFTASDADTKAMKERKEKYGEFEIVKSEYQMTHLWLQPLDGKATQITKGDEYSVTGFAISPDGATIAFAAAANPTPGSSATSDLYTVGIKEKSVKKIVDMRGPESNPAWSPDGKQIAFQTANGAEFSTSNSRIAVVSAGGGATKVLTATFDENPQLLGWNAKGIFFEGREKTASYAYLLDPAMSNWHRVGENDGFDYTGISLTPDGKMAAFVRATPTAYPEIYASSTERFQPVALTKMGDQIKDFTLAKREVISWKSKDGATIEGVLLKPADFDPKKKYPLLVVIHGGPTGIDSASIRQERNYPVEEFIAKGAIVLRPNYRGSAGYGEKFRALNVRNLGVGDEWDVLSGVDSLIAQGFVDANRMGCMGWSQGGYISAFLTTTSDRFKAISVGAGISDWSTYYVNTDITPFTRNYLRATPWDDPEIYQKTSPITYVKQAKTPTLIQHGELDKRVPIPNGYELRQALEDRGVPVKMVVYKGFGHGIDKPKQQRAVMEHNLAWFSKYIWGEGQGL